MRDSSPSYRPGSPRLAERKLPAWGKGGCSAADWLYLLPLAADLRNLVSIEPTEKVYSTVLVIGKTPVPKFPQGCPAAVPLVRSSAWAGLITASPQQEIVGFGKKGKEPKGLSSFLRLAAFSRPASLRLGTSSRISSSSWGFP